MSADSLDSRQDAQPHFQLLTTRAEDFVSALPRPNIDKVFNSYAVRPDEAALASLESAAQEWNVGEWIAE